MYSVYVISQEERPINECSEEEGRRYDNRNK